MNWPLVPLGELVDHVVSWNPARSPSIGSFTYIDLGAVDNASKAITSPSTTTPSNAPSRARQLVRSGDILVSTVRPNLNSVAMVEESLDGATASTGFTVLRPGPRVHNSYLFAWVRHEDFITDMVRKATGASYPAVSDRIVRESLIPLPPMDDQRRIAAALDRVDVLVRRSTDQLAVLGGFGWAIYRSMFGAHQVEWNRIPMGDLIVDSRLGIVRAAAAQGDHLPHAYMKMDAISRTGVILPERFTRVEIPDAELATASAVDGDLLLNTRNTRELVGKTAVHRGAPVLYNNNLVRLRFSEAVTADYLHAFLWSRDGRDQLEARKAGTTSVFAIYAKAMATIMVPLPPRPLQDEFGTRLVEVNSGRALMSQRARRLVQLRHSLRTRAFRGHL